MFCKFQIVVVEDYYGNPGHTYEAYQSWAANGIQIGIWQYQYSPSYHSAIHHFMCHITYCDGA